MSAQPPTHEARTPNPAQDAWADAYAYKAEIEQREAERSELPMPLGTMAALLAISFCALVVLLIWCPEGNL